MSVKEIIAKRCNKEVSGLNMHDMDIDVLEEYFSASRYQI